MNHVDEKNEWMNFYIEGLYVLLFLCPVDIPVDIPVDNPWTIRGQSVNEPAEFPLINRMNIFCFCIFMLKNAQNSTVFQTASNHYKIIWFDCF